MRHIMANFYYIETNNIPYHGYKPGGTLLPPIIRGVMKNPSLRSSDFSAAWEAAAVAQRTANKLNRNIFIGVWQTWRCNRFSYTEIYISLLSVYRLVGKQFFD